MNLVLRAISRGARAEEAMKKLETKRSLVVPQTVPQLPSEGTQLGTKNGVITVQQAQPLEAVRENLAERGGDYIASFSATLLFSVTSFAKPFAARQKWTGFAQQN
jgi:hypothetical protein